MNIYSDMRRTYITTKQLSVSLNVPVKKVYNYTAVFFQYISPATMININDPLSRFKTLAITNISVYFFWIQ